jgi:hypothetical protein
MKYKELKHTVNKEEYEMWFLNYKPDKRNHSKKRENMVEENKRITVSKKQTKHLKKNKTKKRIVKSYNFLI